MKSLGEKFPEFKKAAVMADKSFGEISSEDHKKDGKWMVIFWYPKDFTFVCPTEIVEFNNKYDKFKELNAELYGASTDTEEVHLAWRENDPRATFIVDPEGVIQWVNVNNDSTGRNVSEVLRALEATQNPGLTACNWEPGQPTLFYN